MAEINQNFSMYQGETKNIVVPITSDNPDFTLSGATIKWVLRQRASSTTDILVKENPDITVEDNAFTIHLKPPDTEALLGTYYQICELVDQQANENVLFTGFMTVKV